MAENIIGFESFASTAGTLAVSFKSAVSTCFTTGAIVRSRSSTAGTLAETLYPRSPVGASRTRGYPSIKEKTTRACGTRGFRIFGGSCVTRTRDQRIKSPLLYQLS